MIAKQERTQSSAYQNKDQTQGPKHQRWYIEQRINKNITTALKTAAKATWVLNTFYWRQKSSPKNTLLLKHKKW